MQCFKNEKAVLLASALEFTLLLSFHKNFTPGILRSFAQLLSMPAEWLYIGCGLMLSIIGFYAAYVLCDRILAALKPVKKIAVCNWKALLVLSVVFALSLMTIIRANFDYVDDLGRIREGYQMTGAFSRYIASLMATFLHSNTWLTEISPIPQLLAAVILAFTAVVLYTVITDNSQVNRWGIIALIPIGVFPLFLQCYSYKYDAPYMAFSILAAVLPLAYRKSHPVEFGMATLVGTVLVCTTYQASSGVFPLVVVAVLFGMWNRKSDIKELLSFLIPAVLGYLLGMLIFRFSLMVVPEGGEYVDTTISLKDVLPNIVTFLSSIFMWFTTVWELLIFLIVCGYIAVILQTTKQHKLVALLLALCVVVAMVMLSFGVYIVFEEPLFYPRAMYGFGIALTILCVEISTARAQYFSKAAILLLGLSFFVFSYTYGNTLNMQKEYAEFRINQVLSDINSLETVKDNVSVPVRIVGSIGHPDYLEGTFNEYPLLDALVPVQFADSSWHWGEYALLHNKGMKGKLVHADDSEEWMADMPVLIDTVYHTIRGDGSRLLIELK